MNDIKLCIGPMTKNVVDAIIDYSNEKNKSFILIPSRRQVDFDCGYVEKWDTKTFSEYVRSKSSKILLERDHGGPNQGTVMDDGLTSFYFDSKYLDIIHIDVWKKYQNLEDGILKTIESINQLYSLNNNLMFEIGTEEAIRKFEPTELEYMVLELSKKLKTDVFDRIKYLVIQSGTKLLKNKNVGSFKEDNLISMIDICKKYNLKSKEHNGDYLSLQDIAFKFKNGLDSLNIAPEFGKIETDTYLELIDNNTKMFEKFFKICLDSKKWEKWVEKDFNPEYKRKELIQICGHYVLSNDEFKIIKEQYPEVKDMVKTKVYSKIDKILEVI